MSSSTFYSSISQPCLTHKPPKNASLYDLQILHDVELSRQFELFSDSVGIVDSIVEKSLASFYQSTVCLLENTLTSMVSNDEIPTVIVSKNGGLSDVSNFWEMFHGFCISKISQFTVSFESLRGSASSIVKAFNIRLKTCIGASLPSSFENLKDLGAFSKLNSNSPMVVVVRDLESCEIDLLIYLVRCFHALLSEANIMLVLGISTPVEDALQHIPDEIIRKMNIHKLTLPPTVKQMSKLFFEVFFESELMPVKLGPKVSSFLFKHFLNSDLSVKNFFVCFKYCLFDHFFSNPLACLCVPFDRHLKKPNLSDVELMNLLKSHTSLGISSKNQFLDLIDQEREYNKLLGGVITFLLQLRTKITFSGLPSTSFVLYEYLTDGEFLDSGTWLALKSQIRVLTEEQLTECIELLIDCLPLERYRKKLNSEVLEKLNSQENIDPEVNVKPVNKIPGKLRIHQLKAVIAAEREAAATPLEKAKKVFCQFLEEIITENFAG